MNAVIEHGTPLVDDPDRVGQVRQLGVDETSFLRANREHSTIYATGLVDLEERIVIDMVDGNTAADLRRWTVEGGSGVAGGHRGGRHRSRRELPGRALTASRSRDPGRRSVPCGARREPLRRQGATPGAERDARPSRPQTRSVVSDPQAVARPAPNVSTNAATNGCCSGLRVGDPHDEVLGAWLAKESVRDVYLTDDPDDAAVLLDKAITGCTDDDVAEIQSLGRTLAAWRSRDPRSPHHRREQRPDRRTEPVREESEALRPRVPHLRALPPPRPAPRRRRHLASAPVTATDQNPCSLLRRVEPH